MVKKERKNKFESENKDFYKVKARSYYVPITLQQIKKIIKMFPKETNLSIAQTIGLTENQTNQVIYIMKKSGVNLGDKYPNYSLKSRVENLVKLLK